MLRISLVEYLNTRPFIDGLRAAFSESELALEMLPPAECAVALRENRCDMALVPAGALIDFQGIHLMKDHCIGADGPVTSVFVFSEVPITAATDLLLDPHSRTSNALTRILLRRFWQHDLNLHATQTRDFDRISGTTAGVAIGDRAYKLRGRYQYEYDLAEVWKSWTGLPFVFAVWAFRPEQVPADMLPRLRAALEAGRLQRADSAARWAAQYGYTPEQAHAYLCEAIMFDMNADAHTALRLYTKELQALKPYPTHA